MTSVDVQHRTRREFAFHQEDYGLRYVFYPIRCLHSRSPFQSTASSTGQPGTSVRPSTGVPPFAPLPANAPLSPDRGPPFPFLSVRSTCRDDRSGPLVAPPTRPARVHRVDLSLLPMTAPTPY